MNKTRFRMPERGGQATPEIDRWVKGGQGDPAAEKPVKADRTTGKVARLTIDLPPDLHARFKATCAIRRTRMIDEVRQFIEEWTQKHGMP